MKLEAAGKPTVAIATDRFQAMAARAAKGFGLANARVAVVSHPIGGETDSVLREMATRAVDEVMALFTAQEGVA